MACWPSSLRGCRPPFPVAVACMLGAFAAFGQETPPAQLSQRITVRSVSGQFIVSGTRPDFARQAALVAKLDTNHVLLQPATLSLTAERIKEAVREQLQSPREWRGRIYLTLHAETNALRAPVAQAGKFADGWHFRVDLPERMEKERVVSAITSVVLQEIATRTDPDHAVEVPLWLSEGLARHVQASALEPLVLQPELFVVERQLQALPPRVFDSQRLPDPYRLVRAQFEKRTPCSFSDLDQPRDARGSAEDWEHFRCSAQMFVGELLKLRDGPACLAEFLRLLPNYLNWQLAFQRAFKGHFASALDIEKWWEVTLVTFQGRDRHMKVSMEEGLRQLSQILAVPVQVRGHAATLPQPGVTTLQRLLTEADFATQQAALPTVILQLRALQWNVPTDLLKLIDDYRFTIESYLHRRGKSAGAGGGRSLSPDSHATLVRETVQRLNLLDALHADFARYGIRSAAAAPPPATLNP